MKSFLLFLFLLIISDLYSQDRKLYEKDSTRIRTCPVKMMQCQPAAITIKEEIKRLPFNCFSVMDVRADTATAGIQVKSKSFSANNFYYKLKFSKPASEAIADYINSRFAVASSSSKLRAVFFIKELRISQSDSLNKNTNNGELYNKISFQSEVYLVNKNGYYPAYKLDTVMKLLTDDKDDFSILSQTLDLMVNKSAIIDTFKIFSRKAYSLTEINARYNQRFDKPVLTAKKLNPGIYKRFEEFVNNNPSIQQYDVRKDKKSTNLYSKEEGSDWQIETKAFGFCDGTIVWINVDNIYRPLVRYENTFEFLGDYYNLEYRAGAGYSNVIVMNNPILGTGITALYNIANGMSYTAMKGKIVHQLNMETGAFY